MEILQKIVIKLCILKENQDNINVKILTTSDKKCEELLEKY